MYLLGTHSLVIEKHKGYSPFQIGNRAERDQIITWTNNDAQGIHPYGKSGYEKAISVLLLFTVYYL